MTTCQAASVQNLGCFGGRRGHCWVHLPNGAWDARRRVSYLFFSFQLQEGQEKPNKKVQEASVLNLRWPTTTDIIQSSWLYSFGDTAVFHQADVNETSQSSGRQAVKDPLRVWDVSTYIQTI